MKKQELIKGLKRTRDSYDIEDEFRSGVRTGLSMSIFLIKQLDEPEKVVIPKFVADWIEEMKQDERPLYSVMSSLMNKTNHEWAIWKSANMNFSEIVAQAWLDGYEVEKEKLYYVVSPDNLTMLYKDNGVEVKSSHGYLLSQVTQLKFEHKPFYQLTEKEIKDYDERYWSFAVEVEE